MRAVVKKVAKYFPTAIISGRSRDKVIGWFLFKLFILLTTSLEIFCLFASKYPWLLILEIACPTHSYSFRYMSLLDLQNSIMRVVMGWTSWALSDNLFLMTTQIVLDQWMSR